MPLKHLKGLKWVGKLSLQDADILAELGGQAISILETGMGGSTLIFSQVCKDVTSVESDPVWIDLTRKRLDHLGTLSSVRLLNKINPALDKEYDLVFIDCLVETRLNHAAMAWRKLKPGGVLMIHDTNRSVYLNIATSFIASFLIDIDHATINKVASDGKSSNITYIKKMESGVKEFNWKNKENKPPWAYSEDRKVEITRMWEYNEE